MECEKYEVRGKFELATRTNTYRELDHPDMLAGEKWIGNIDNNMSLPVKIKEYYGEYTTLRIGVHAFDSQNRLMDRHVPIFVKRWEWDKLHPMK